MLDWQEKMAEAVFHIENLYVELTERYGGGGEFAERAIAFTNEVRNNIGPEWFGKE